MRDAAATEPAAGDWLRELRRLSRLHRRSVVDLETSSGPPPYVTESVSGLALDRIELEPGDPPLIRIELLAYPDDRYTRFVRDPARVRFGLTEDGATAAVEVEDRAGARIVVRIHRSTLDEQAGP